MLRRALSVRVSARAPSTRSFSESQRADAGRVTSDSSPAPPTPSPHVLLEYTYDARSAEELAARRAALRPLHLAHATAARARGELVLGGAVAPLAGEPPGGLLVFRGPSEATARSFAESDPYVTGIVAETGRPLVRSWRTRAWAVVIR